MFAGKFAEIGKIKIRLREMIQFVDEILVGQLIIRFKILPQIGGHKTVKKVTQNGFTNMSATTLVTNKIA